MIASYVPYVVAALANEPIDSVLELACGDRQNLRAIQESYPHIAVDGSELYHESPDPRVDISKPPFPYEDKSYDCVLLAATLLLFDDKQTDAILAEARRIARKLILLVEKHIDGETVDKGDSAIRRYHRDYKKLGFEIVSEDGVWKGQIMKQHL